MLHLRREFSIFRSVEVGPLDNTACTCVALDAMGGDYAPDEAIQGAVDAVSERKNIKVLLVGREAVLAGKLKAYTYPKEQIEIVPASEVIETAEHPVKAIVNKKDSSIVVGMKLVREGKADGFISAGNSGAVLVGGQTIVGRVKGVERSPFAAIIPTKNGVSLLLDAGANVDARASHLVQFARMGSIYMEEAIGVKNPKVGIVNVGAEEEKGNALVKETFPLLKACTDINFVGSCEARDIPMGACDVVVCEGFTGNCLVKMYEGAGIMLRSVAKECLLSSTRSKLGALLIKPAIRTAAKKFDASAYGSAPMLGLKGLVVKAHGNAKAKQFKFSIFQVETFKKQDLGNKIGKKFEAEAEAKKETLAARRAAKNN